MYITKCAGRVGVARSAIAGVEAPLKSNLDEKLGSVDMLDDGVRRIEVERDRLLAKGRDRGIGSHMQEVGVRRGGRRDDQRIDA